LGVDPFRGPGEGGTAVTIRGDHFDHASAGETSVLFGENTAQDVEVVDDETITCTTPPGVGGTVNVTVVNENGRGTLPAAYTYLAPTLWVAAGKAGYAGNLFTVDVSTGEASPVGLITDGVDSFGITGMTWCPPGVDGTLYAVNSSQFNYGYLLTINPATAAATVVGPLLDDGGRNHAAVPDITCVDGRLIGWTEQGNIDMPIEIDRSTGGVEMIGGGTESSGSGLAANADGLVYSAPEGNSGVLYMVDVRTGEVTAGPTMSGGEPGRSTINSLAFLEGVLYGVGNNAIIDPTSQTDLIRIDLSTGAVTTVGPLPTPIDAIAGNFY
jgi:hypothetical protein